MTDTRLPQLVDASASDSDYGCAWDFAELQSQAAEDTDHEEQIADPRVKSVQPINRPLWQSSPR